MNEIDMWVYQHPGQAGTSWSVIVSNGEVKLHGGGYELEYQVAIEKASKALENLLGVVNGV